MRHTPRMFLFLFLTLMLDWGAARAGDNECELLIDRLLAVSEPGFGYSGYFSGSEFLPYEGSGEIGTAVIGATQRARSDALLALVTQGAETVPTLLKHLDDRRTIKMKPLGGMMWIAFPDEYDFNRRTHTSPPKGVNRDHFEQAKNVPDQHLLTVGDLCYVALGQIVNRNFSATRYQPTGGLIVNSPTYSAVLCKEVREDWSGLTKDRHKALLIDDFQHPDYEHRRIGAYLRLALYYPEAVEPLVLEVLRQPTFNATEAWNLVHDKLYPAKLPGERKRIFDAYIVQHGQVAKDGLLEDLFQDLDSQEADEEHRLSPPLKEKYEARACLVELFGYPRSVKSAGRPQMLSWNDNVQARFIKALTHDPSQKVGDVVRQIYLAHPDDDYLAPACLECLANRGYGPFLVEQLNKIHLSDAETNWLRLKSIRAISPSRQKEVRAKLLEIVKTTTNDDYFMAALPALDRTQDAIVLEHARRILAALPPETKQGEALLEMIGERFPGRARAIYRSFLANGNPLRAETMCRVLWYGNPLAIEILAPMLDDRRALEGFTSPMRVCDRAATAVSQATGTIRFDSDWPSEEKEAAIAKLKKFCEAKNKPAKAKPAESKRSNQAPGNQATEQ